MATQSVATHGSANPADAVDNADQAAADPQRARMMAVARARAAKKRAAAADGAAGKDAHPAAGQDAHGKDAHEGKDVHEGKDAGDDESGKCLTEMMALPPKLALDVLPLWNHGVDALDPSAIRAAAAATTLVWQHLNQCMTKLESTPLAAMAQSQVQAVHSELNTLGHWQFRGSPVLGPPPPSSDGDTAGWIAARAEALAKCAGDALQMIELCKKSKPDGKGHYEIESGDEVAIVQLLQSHPDTTETGFLWEVLRQNHFAPLIESFGMVAGGALGLREKRQDEAAATKGFHDGGIAPERLSHMRDCVNAMAHLVDDQVDSADFYMTLLNQFTGPERAQIVRMLNQRGILDDMGHIGGDEVVEYIKGTDGFGSWKVDQAQVTVRTKMERLENAAQVSDKAAPGNLCHFASGFYHGLGHLPVIGGVFDRAGDAFGDLGDFSNEKLGVDADIANAGKIVENGLGHLEEAVFEGVVGKAVKAGQAGAALEEARGAQTVINTASTGNRAVQFIGELQDTWSDMQTTWPMVSTLVSDLGSLAVGDGIDQARNDPKRAQNLVDGVDKTFTDVAGKLKALAGVHFTEEGEEKQHAAEEAIEHRDENRSDMVERTASASLKTDLMMLVDANRRLTAPGSSPEQRAEAQSEMQKYGELVKQQKSQLEAAQAADGQRQSEEADWDKKAKAAKKDPNETGLHALKHNLGQELRTSIIGLIAGGIDGARKSVVKDLKAYLAGKGEGVDAKKALVAGLADGIADGVAGHAEEYARDKLAGLAQSGIEKICKVDKGSFQIFSESFKTLSEGLVKKLGIKDHLAKAVEPAIGKLFGVEEEEPKEEKKAE